MGIKVTGVVIALVATKPAYARPCATVAACVEQARRPPEKFTSSLVPLLAALPTDALIEGMSLTLPNAPLAEHVRMLATYAMHGRPLSEPQAALLFERWLATPDPAGERFRGPLDADPKGRRLLLGWVAAHEDLRASKLAWSLVAQNRVQGADRARCIELVWSAYLGLRGMVGPEHDAIMNFMANQPTDFASRAHALVLGSLGKRLPLVYDDLDLMARQPTAAVLDELLTWSATDTTARGVLVVALQSAADPIIAGLQKARANELDARVLDMLRGSDASARLQAVHALRRLYASSRPAAIGTTVLTLAGDPDERVRDAVFRVLEEWSNDPAARAALVAAVRRFDPAAAQHLFVSRGPKLPEWKLAEAVALLRGLPEASWGEARWQTTLGRAGRALEVARGKRYGFDATAGDDVGRCGNDRLESMANARDLELLDPAAYHALLKKQPATPGPEAQATATATRRDQLLAARNKLLQR
jgi:hypothetical protein